MKTMIISEFKAKCIATLKEVQRNSQPVIVTLRGRPIAEIEPIASGPRTRRLGAQRGSVRILGDIVGSDFAGDWNVCKE